MSHPTLDHLSPAIKLSDGRYFMVSRQRWQLLHWLKPGLNKLPRSVRAILPYLDVVYADEPAPKAFTFSGFTLDQFRRLTATWGHEDHFHANTWIKNGATQQFLRETLKVIQTFARGQHRDFVVSEIPFRSHLIEFLNTTRQKVATAKQWQATLEKVPGLRSEDIALSGLETLWGKHDQDARLTREELLATVDHQACVPVLVSESVSAFRISSRYIDMGRLVTRRANYVAKPPSYCIERYRHASMGYRILLNRYRDLSAQEPIWIATDEKWRQLALTRHDGRHTRFQTLEEAKASIEAAIDRRFRNYGHAYAHTRWNSYVLPGGTDYREHFLVLPNWPRQFIGPHFDLPNVLIHLRTTQRTDMAGQRLWFLEELQSDWHQIGKRHGYDTEHSDSPPYAPFASEWMELGLKAFIWLAMRAGIDHVAWTSGQLQEWRYQCTRLGLVTFYDRTLPNILKKLSPWNVHLGNTVIETRKLLGDLLETERGHWYVTDDDGNRFSKRFNSSQEAEQWQLRHSPIVKVSVPMVTLSEALKTHLRLTGWSLFGGLR